MERFTSQTWKSLTLLEEKSIFLSLSLLGASQNFQNEQTHTCFEFFVPELIYIVGFSLLLPHVLFSHQEGETIVGLKDIWQMTWGILINYLMQDPKRRGIIQNGQIFFLCCSGQNRWKLCMTAYNMGSSKMVRFLLCKTHFAPVHSDYKLVTAKQFIEWSISIYSQQNLIYHIWWHSFQI